MTSGAKIARTCEICGERSQHRAHFATERMFGDGESFIYLECLNCESLALGDPPPFLSRHYPPSYYAFNDRGYAAESVGLTALRARLMRMMLRSRSFFSALVVGGGVLGLKLQPWTRLLGGAGLDLDARVLDVGCGDGHRLETFRRFGFRRLTGIDAYRPSETGEANGMVLSRKRLEDLDGHFDLIMFHHSFEHMSEPLDVLGEVFRLLRPGGLLLVRIPLAGSYAWRTYGVDWVQLDAPRHLFLFSARGLTTMAERAGFGLRTVLYDSTPFQFWGSELYRRGVSLQSSGSVDGLPPPTLARRQVRQWERQSKALNAARDGDQAAFLFTKVVRPVSSPQTAKNSR